MSFNISKDLRDDVQEVPSETPETRLWRITVPAPACSQHDEYSHDTTGPLTFRELGHPKSYLRSFSLQRLSASWLGPQHGRQLEHANGLKDAVVYSFLGNDGQCLVLLAISGVRDVQTVLKAEGSNLLVSIRNDSNMEQSATVLASTAKSFDTGLAATIYEARKMLSPHRIDQGMGVRWRQAWLDGLGYSTWNALGRDLTEQRLLDCVKTLREHKVPVSSLIIDDNWQSLDEDRRWTRFEANRDGFPQGLNSTVAKIGEQHPGITTIGVWHALFGYWNGVSPDGEIARTYATRKVDVEPSWTNSTTSMTIIDPSDITRALKDFYDFLSTSGINCVKCDVRSAADTLSHPFDRQSLQKSYLSASEIAYFSHFGSRTVACMSQAPTNLFFSHLPQNIAETVLRNSDDYFPDEEASHPWHVWCNAHNAIFTRYLNVVPDWDMLQTKHPWGWFHAAARAVSGGPVFITDRPGEHDMQVLDALTAETPRGDSVVLRPSVVGRSMTAFEARGEGLLKVGAYHGGGRDGAAITAVFNITDLAMTEILHVARDFMGTDGDASAKEYVVTNSRHGDAVGPFSPASPDAIFATTLEGHGWDILTATPIHFLTPQIETTSNTSRERSIRLSNLGLLHKLTGAASIISTSASLDQPSERARITTTLKALGVWGVWTDRRDVDIDGEVMVLLEGRAVPRACVEVGSDHSGAGEAESVEGKGGSVLSVDLGSAWREMGLRSGFRNEVNVEMFVSLDARRDSGESFERRKSDDISEGWVAVE
ncbi:MAG: hypothetical protein M1831_002705 [Alyxoria varia]|nr:MAG: hypothetical protein M1831_002705 [Alyxoria varia]